MLIKIIMIILILSPICNGITYLFVSNHPSSPYCTVAKYKTLDDTYKYKNKQAGIVYICLGFIIALFLLLLCFLYNFFDTINPISKIFGLYIIIFLIENIIFDTLLNIKFQLKNFEENFKKDE